jgi:hypothetical protein
MMATAKFATAKRVVAAPAVAAAFAAVPVATKKVDCERSEAALTFEAANL